MIRKSSSDICVNCGLPAHSPTAHTSGALIILVRLWDLLGGLVVVIDPNNSEPVRKLDGTAPVLRDAWSDHRRHRKSSGLQAVADDPTRPLTRLNSTRCARMRCKAPVAD